MTPDEVFSRLRDLHSPEIEAAAGQGWDLRPLLIFAAMVLLGVGLHHWRRWRNASASLAHVAEATNPADQRDRIVHTLQNRPRHTDRTSPPTAFFVPPAKVTKNDAEDLRRWARRRFR